MPPSPEDNPADEMPIDQADYEYWHRDGVVERLRKLLTAQPLKASISGGGMPSDTAVSLDYALLITRGEVDNIIRLFGGMPPDAAVDGKYGAIATSKKQLHPGEPVFLFRATDPLAPWGIVEYANKCRAMGCSDEHVRACVDHAERIEAWQKAHPELVKKLPD